MPRNNPIGIQSMSIPEQNNPGSYTLVYPFPSPAKVHWLYTGRLPASL